MTAEEAGKLLSGRVLLPRQVRGIPEGITPDELRAADIPEGTIIRDACLYAEQPDMEILPKGLRNVRFERCNTENLRLDAKAGVVSDSARTYGEMG